MNTGEYFKRVYRLAFIHRYTNVVRVRSEDVAQHSFFVAAIILKLHDEYDFDLGKALQAAIAHDISEADLSDVTHDVKVRYPFLSEAISKAEDSVIADYPAAVMEGHFEFKSMTSVESLIANLADVIQVQQYVLTEIQLGNNDMDIILRATRKRRAHLKESLRAHQRNIKKA